MPSWLIAIASVLLATFPVFIWIHIIHREGEEKSLYVKTFLTGTLSVIPPFLIIFLFDAFPQLNIYAIIHRDFAEQVALTAIFTNIVVGIIEEIAKNIIVRVIDKRHPEYIQTIGSALKLSICAGLGFSFAENIFYFYNVWANPEYGTRDLFATFIFRSLFTMCGHMVFSGIFGYYFGIGKFSADITEFSRWDNKESRTLRFARWVSRITGELTSDVMREFQNITGLLLAMGMHASFNASLDLEHKLPSIMIVTLAAAYIAYLMQTKSGHLMFDATKRRASTMAFKDENVVMELMGMWTKEGKYQEVMDICDRLLQKDPNNNVVKLFRAKAADNKELKGFYNSLKAMFEKPKISVTALPAGVPSAANLNVTDEKVVLEVMDMWYKEKKYKEVLDVANRLLQRNPASAGAKLLMEKAMDKEKLRKVFDSLSMLFKD